MCTGQSRCRQFLSKTLFSSDATLCHVDKGNHHIYLGTMATQGTAVHILVHSSVGKVSGSRIVKSQNSY